MKDLHSWYCTLVVQISNWSNQSRAVQWPDGFSCCSFLSCLINGPSLWICIWNNECIWSVFSNAILILISKISVSFKILWVLCSVVNIWLVFIAPLQILLSHKLDWKKKKSRLSFFKDFENITLKNTQRETSSLETNEVNSHSPTPAARSDWQGECFHTNMFQYQTIPSLFLCGHDVHVLKILDISSKEWFLHWGGKKGNFYFEEKDVSFFSKHVKYSSVYIVQQFFSCNIQSAQQRPSQ